MRRLLSIASIALLSLGVLFSITTAPARAEDLSQSQIDEIKTNCVAIKNSLNQLHASDALLRVNRGQIYESMASKLMERFNERLSNNNLDNTAMNTVTNNYRSALSDFRVHYISYEQKMSEALRTDCVTEPNLFHNTILEARELRSDVHKDVTRLHRLIDDYRSATSTFLVNYERETE